MAALQPHLEPDPFDKVIEEMLRDPEIRADLDDQHAKFERGELKTYTHAEVRKRLLKRGVPLVDESASDT